ncbi:hydroxyacyl-CoA dehydrogenase [Aureimonas endophytica]|uniref:Hydroxyacyl-CoA dehydrogenase n=1 Tax=Aureimonas endophytica TaxID=2027858 RepID=A0A916ZNE0_9HYPH|nr:3-hydroxyacyl-CoA dehydrogenase NAD-binding domain-containing protein [Aureimonas endophytica]GGE05902.1 hydroxyacyl-CoA dehydrogenase [Aureimonas endophytica]
MSEPLFRRVGIVGFGTIGQRWAAVFAHQGLAVGAYDPDPGRAAEFAALRPGLEADLAALLGPARPGGRVRVATDMGAALAGAQFVQECGPEQLEIKQALLAEIERHVEPSVTIASSSSALSVSAMQALCRHPGRVVLGHPFNPAHLMPLVEIVGGEASEDAHVRAARAFYEAIGKKPVTLNREITGHLALRLMGALWREAIALVEEGVASVEDVDRAFIYGPGPKWTLQGSFISNHLNAEGMESFLAKYGATYEAIWADLKTASLSPATRAAVAAGTRAAIGERSDEALRSARDAGLVEILKTVARKGAL